MSEELSVSKQRIRGDRRGRTLGSLFVGDMNRLEWNIVFFRRLPHPRNPIVCKRALIGVVEHEPVFVHRGMLGAFLEFWQLRILFKRQGHEIDAAIGYVGYLETFVGQELRVGKELSFAPLGRENANAFAPLLFGVSDAFAQQITGMPMTFQRTSHPQTVDINPSVSIDRHPCVFRRNIFDEAFASFLATIKDETFVETLLEPLFFARLCLPDMAQQICSLSMFSSVMWM